MYLNSISMRILKRADEFQTILMQAMRKSAFSAATSIKSARGEYKNLSLVVQYLFVGTATILIISLVVFIRNYSSGNLLSDFGTYFGSIFSSIALLWLIASHMLARLDLRDQRMILTQQYHAQKDMADHAKIEMILRNREALIDIITIRLENLLKLDGSKIPTIPHRGHLISEQAEFLVELCTDDLLKDHLHSLRDTPGWGAVKLNIAATIAILDFVIVEDGADRSLYLSTLLTESASLEKIRSVLRESIRDQAS